MQNNDQKLTQLNNALNNAISSLNLAKNLLKELQGTGQEVHQKVVLPGLTGKFNGEAMVTDDGKKFPVSPNYAAKSMLVFGDTLKMVEENGESRFKQIERVKRLKIDGVLARKEGRWHAVTSDGSYRVSDSAVEYLGGKEGSTLIVLLPETDRFAPFATVDTINGVSMEVKKLEHKKAPTLTTPSIAHLEEKPSTDGKVDTQVVVEAPVTHSDEVLQGDVDSVAFEVPNLDDAISAVPVKHASEPVSTPAPVESLVQPPVVKQDPPKPALNPDYPFRRAEPKSFTNSGSPVSPSGAPKKKKKRKNGPSQPGSAAPQATHQPQPVSSPATPSTAPTVPTTTAPSDVSRILTDEDLR